MSRSTQKSRREKVDLCFITSDPSSTEGKTNNLHVVRSHAGKWRWSEARKKKTHVNQEKSDLRDEVAVGLQSRDIQSSFEKLDASDSSSTFKSSSSSKASTPDNALDHLFNTLEEGVSGEDSECLGAFPLDTLEQMRFIFSTQIQESKSSGYCNAGAMNVHGITPNILDPFQQYPHTSPLPSQLH
ncbi:unnamed protein product [Penicillium pancosmium]